VLLSAILIDENWRYLSERFANKFEGKYKWKMKTSRNPMKGIINFLLICWTFLGFLKNYCVVFWSLWVFLLIWVLFWAQLFLEKLLRFKSVFVETVFFTAIKNLSKSAALEEFLAKNIYTFWPYSLVYKYWHNTTHDMRDTHYVFFGQQFAL